MDVFTKEIRKGCNPVYKYSPFGNFGFEASIYKWHQDSTWRVFVSREEYDSKLDYFFQKFDDATSFAIYHVNNFNKKGMFPEDTTDIEIDLNSCVCPIHRLNTSDPIICLGCGRSFPSWDNGSDLDHLPCGCYSLDVSALEEDMLPNDEEALKSIVFWLSSKLDNYG